MTATDIDSGSTSTAPSTGSVPGRTRPRRREPVKYQRVADALREQIASGELQPASPLPSETELIEIYGVSRSTARAAIDVLRSEGLVVVQMGRGAFVRRDTDRPARTHTRAVTRTDSGGYADATETERWHVIEHQDVGGTFRTDATADLALALGVPQYTPLFIYERLLAGPAGQRLLHRLYLPFTTAADVPALTEDPFLPPAELYAVLDTAGHTLSWTETVRARMPTPTDTTALRVADATPVLITRRTTTDATTGRALALEETRVSAEDTQLAYTLNPATH